MRLIYTLYESIPGWLVVLAGLKSSSVNGGSRTDIGLGLVGLSMAPLTSYTCLAIEEDGGEEGGGFSSKESWKEIGTNIISMRTNEKPIKLE